VERELDAIREIGGVSTITILDDTFNVPKARFKEILRMMIKNNYGFKWNCFYRCDQGDEESIELMGRAGCEGVFLGVESGSDTMLETMNKTARRTDYLTAIPLLKDAGISTYASLIVGFPGETADTVHQTIEFIEKARPEFYRAQLWYADPVTPIWKLRDKYQIKGAAFNWSHVTMDSQTACDWIDKIFLSVDASVWLPQLGFEQWALFYLQRKGMPMDRIKTFLRMFNRVKREQIVSQKKKTISSEMAQRFRKACTFDDPGVNLPALKEEFSGRHYLAAEEFWSGESTTHPPLMKSALGLPILGSTAQRSVFWGVLDPDLAETLIAQYELPIAEIALGALALLISRLDGQEDVAILSAVKEETEWNPLPLRLKPCWGASRKEFLKGVSKANQMAREHRVFSRHILTNWILETGQETSRPTFEVGYLFFEATPSQYYADLSEVLEHDSEVLQNISLVLNVIARGNRYFLELVHCPSGKVENLITDLGNRLIGILRELAGNPEEFVGQTGSGNGSQHNPLTTDRDAAEAFRF